jgi:hypothetical protein
MFIISLFLFANVAIAPEGETGDYSDASGIVIDGDNASITMPIAESQDFNIWLIGGALTIIGIAIAVGIVSGISVLGSGASVYSQKLLVISVLYIGLWASLTVITATLMFDELLTKITWIGLTMVFMLGLATLITEGDEE